MSERTDKIADLEEKLTAIELYYQDIKKKRDELSQQLAFLKKVPEPNTVIRVQTTCNRGCCIEQDFSGRFKSVAANGLFTIELDDGTTATVHESDIVK